MSGADDWTKEIMTKGFPELKQHYTLLAPDNVMAKALLQFDHNYNFVSREVMYQWFNKHLELGLPEPVIEEDFSLRRSPKCPFGTPSIPGRPAAATMERSLVKGLTVESRPPTRRPYARAMPRRWPGIARWLAGRST